MHPLQESIDVQKEMVRVDFANEYVGGASLAYGCVQEVRITIEPSSRSPATIPIHEYRAT